MQTVEERKINAADTGYLQNDHGVAHQDGPVLTNPGP